MKKKIELSNEQYKSLVKLIFYGEWVLHANKIGEEGRNKKLEELQEYIFSQKEKFSLEDWFEKLEYGEELKEVVIMDLLEKVFEYNEDTFWFYLVKKLAERDVLIESLHSGEMTSENEEILLLKHEEKYEKAFKNREINALFLKNKK